jgi:hypothetical protein
VPIDWDALIEEGNYLGSTSAFIDAVLATASAITSGAKASSQ